MAGVLEVMLLLGGAPYWLLRTVAVLVRIKQRRWALGADDLPEAAKDGPLVSIIVPARDEAGSIGPCVEALLAQGYTNLELIVIDDDSSDGTADEARAAAAGDSRLTVLEGTPLPSGWKGKCWAVWQGQKAASGAWLLFVDADVVLAPAALEKSLGHALSRQVAMVSLWGQLRLGSFWERVMQPFISDFILLFSPLARVNDEARGDDCIANGQFILIERTAYDAIGGHEAVATSIVEDVSIGRAVKGSGLGFHMLFSWQLMEVHMYDGFASTWSGWRKNFFAGMRSNPSAAFFAELYLFWTSVLPWGVLALCVGQAAVSGAALSPLGWLAAAAVGMTLLFRWLTTPFHDAGPLYAFLHPVSALLLMGIIFDSTIRGLAGREVAWKGRSYAADVDRGLEREG